MQYAAADRLIQYSCRGYVGLCVIHPHKEVFGVKAQLRASSCCQKGSILCLTNLGHQNLTTLRIMIKYLTYFRIK